MCVRYFFRSVPLGSPEDLREAELILLLLVDQQREIIYGKKFSCKYSFDEMLLEALLVKTEWRGVDFYLV